MPLPTLHDTLKNEFSMLLPASQQRDTPHTAMQVKYRLNEQSVSRANSWEKEDALAPAVAWEAGKGTRWLDEHMSPLRGGQRQKEEYWF